MRRGDDAGFTLIELLSAVGILGVISLPLTGALIVGLRTVQTSADRLGTSVAVQTLASFYTADVQSADEVTTSDADCAPDDATRIVRLGWEDAGSNVASYVLEPPVDGGQELVRWFCREGQVAQRRVLGRLATEAVDAVAVTCSPGGRSCPLRPVTVTLTYAETVTAGPLQLTARRRTA